jgi:adenosylmethionine-8-amino-7-oxononanoate aminotransferase
MTHFPTIVRGEGIYLWDDQGNRYIDVISGAVVSNLGQGNARVAEAMAHQACTMTFTYVRYARHLPNIELSEKIAHLAGPGYERPLFISGGSEANDMAIKLLRQYAVARGEHSKTRMISLMPSFHGNTLGTIAVTGDEDFEPLYGQMVQFSAKIPAPSSYRLRDGETPLDSALATTAALEKTIVDLGPENVLGFMLEPVGGVATGAVVPPPEYFRQIRRICTRYGIMLVFDEVMTAVRTGKFLAAHIFTDAKPDLIVMAKGLGAGYVPMGAVLAPASMIDELAETTGFNPSHTFNANPVSCAGASAVIDETVRLDLMNKSVSTGAYLKMRLSALAEASPIIGDVRGIGLLQAIELTADKATKRLFPPELYVSNRLRLIGLEEGLILYARRQSGGKYGEWSMMTPPLIISEGQIDEIIERLQKCLSRLTDELVRQGVMK